MRVSDLSQISSPESYDEVGQEIASQLDIVYIPMREQHIITQVMGTHPRSETDIKYVSAEELNKKAATITIIMMIFAVITFIVIFKTI